ncbi:putative origin recognition complex subunit 2 [Cryptosporidium bovis]|uniref:putative origin recognition complex subunit 2 n=1 Tax=Cryptosporidium bovis TaxID=310047 RepID=UPI003519F867|nr:putative origin recognition complex subunit 2 [Cryptosporidium bovis]
MRGTFSDYLIREKENNQRDVGVLDEADPDKLVKIDLANRKKDEECIKLLKDGWGREYEKILSWCLTGFSVIIYGFGSKKNFLDRFIDEKIKGRYITLIIRGYFKQVKFKNCLIELLKNIDKFYQEQNNSIDQEPFTSSDIDELSIETIIQRINLLHDRLFNIYDNIFIVIHNIDNISLRSYLPAITKLVQIPFITLVASVDNIRWPVLWNTSMRHKMNVLYMNISTIEEYKTEIDHLYGDKLPGWLGADVDKADQKYTLDQFNSVLNCLTPSHVQLAKAIAEIQYKNECVPEEQLYRKLRSSMIVTTKSALSQLLVELLSHEILTKQYSSDKNETKTTVYMLKLEREEIKEFLGQFE